MKFLVTGAAGFIGYHISKRLLDNENQVVGIDNLNDSYDSNLKKARLRLINNPNFSFYKLDLIDQQGMKKLFLDEKFDRVIHLAAQSNARFSLENPYIYANTNLIGYLNILECCRFNRIQHLLYASSSSVYGLNNRMPFSTDDGASCPVSFYAVTKISNELMSYTYSHLYNLPTTGLRFFTVYGPWGRPDMAFFKFTKSIVEDRSIDVYNYGRMKRDFTYIDDVVEAVFLLQGIIPQRNIISQNASLEHKSYVPHRVYNIGHGDSVELMDCIKIIEEELGMKAKKNMLPIHPGDVPNTSSDIKKLYELTGFRPKTSIKKGIQAFIDWYKNFYDV